MPELVPSPMPDQAPDQMITEVPGYVPDQPAPQAQAELIDSSSIPGELPKRDPGATLPAPEMIAEIPGVLPSQAAPTEAPAPAQPMITEVPGFETPATTEPQPTMSSEFVGERTLAGPTSPYVQVGPGKFIPKEMMPGYAESEPTQPEAPVAPEVPQTPEAPQA